MRQNRLSVYFILALTLTAAQRLAAQAGPASASVKPPAGAAAPPQQQPAGATCSGEDRFASLRCVADQLRAAYDKVDDENMGEIEKLMKDKRCNIVRIDGLLTRAKDAMNLWFDAEKKYWNETEIAENARVEGQQKSLASMVEDQATAQQLLDSLQRDHDELLRGKAELEKNPKRTQEIQKAIDELILDIQADEIRIADAQKHLDDATISVNNQKIALDARLIEIRQYQRRIDVWKEQRESYYQTSRAAADAVCSIPGTRPNKALPAPKGAPQ
jgi:hypothetical protein